MCRFIAYKGKKPIVLKTLFIESENSLLKQSRLAKEAKTGLNADGFGLGWYDQRIDADPAIFKSIQPAFNDENLIHIASKVLSDCFIGHVRASTVGEVSISNCHPFSYKQFLFAHNGTIHHFDKIKKDLLLYLDEDYFSKIKGKTDSEHFFYLLSNIIEKKMKDFHVNSIAKACKDSIEIVKQMFFKKKLEYKCHLNFVITDGKQMLAVRHTSNLDEPPPSLHFSIKNNSAENDSIIISSERLNDLQKWEDIQVNDVLLVDEKLRVSSISLSKI